LIYNVELVSPSWVATVSRWKESEWLLGTSRQLGAIQDTAREDGEKKRGFREEVEYIRQLTTGGAGNAGLVYQTAGMAEEDVLY
jgi:hypothetical protein